MSTERSFLVDPNISHDGVLMATPTVQGAAGTAAAPAGEALAALARLGRPASPAILPVLDLLASFTVMAVASAGLDLAAAQGRWALFALALMQTTLLALFLANGLYDRRVLRSPGRMGRAAVAPAAFVVSAALAIGQIAPGAPTLADSVAGQAAVTCAILVMVRLGWLAAMRVAGRPMDDPIVLVGSPDAVREYLDETRVAFGRDPDRLKQIAGYLSTDGSAGGHPDLPRLATIDPRGGSRALLAGLPPTTQLVVVVQDSEDEALRALLRQLFETSFSVRLALLPSLRLRHDALSTAYGAEGAILLQPASLTPSQWASKRFLDLTLTSVGLLLIAPLLAFIAIAIKLDSPGPVFFRQKRHGLNSRPFDILKFRTMQHRPDASFEQARRNDPRVTRIGGFLRKTSLDELPQLFNVLGGTMSLVGPRPHPVELNERYAPEVGRLFARHRLPPGLTGLAQINHNRGETATADRMQERVMYDLRYVRNYSVWKDVRIILMTFVSILRNKDVY